MVFLFMPFTVAGIYEYATINGEPVISMSMLTINADMHPFMKQFHAPDDEKRSIVVIPKEHRNDWLICNHDQARDFLHNHLHVSLTHQEIVRYSFFSFL